MTRDEWNALTDISPGPGPASADLVTLTRRTDGDKLRTLRVLLHSAGIPTWITGESAHAPILSCRRSDAAIASATVWGYLDGTFPRCRTTRDDMPDDHWRFSYDETMAELDAAHEQAEQTRMWRP
jgi:hypothetical protein